MLEHFGTNGGQKVAKNFDCNPCLYSCKKESDWTKHISTRKHKTRTKVAVLEQDGEKVAAYGKDLSSKSETGDFLAAPLLVCECGKQYTARNSFWYHKKHCYVHQAMITDNHGQKKGQSSESQQLVPLGKHADAIFKSTSSYMKGTTHEKENSIDNENGGDKDKDVEFKELVLLLLKENKEIQKTFVDILPHIKGHNSEHSFNTTNTNSNNTNNFNIQMFLNEQCKNAMNLTEFIDSLPITADTYDNTIENGLTKTITTMITNGLNNMDITDRPIHCTDPARKTMYVKDNDVWEKDNELRVLLQGIRNLSFKQRTMINKWQDVNVGWDKDDNLQTRLTTLVCHSMTDIENDEKEMNKIYRAIGKNTYLTSEIKHDIVLQK
jgi:hypothetical protein